MSLSIKNWTLEIGNFRLGPLTAEFPQGSLTHIQGPNGSGKTSFLKSLLGRARVLTGELSGLESPIAPIGVEGFLMSEWTVAENLEWFSHALRCSRPEISELYSFSYKKVNALSAGMRRRCELLIAFHLPFKTFLLDEAMSPLDLEHRGKMLRLMEQACDQGRTVIFTEHEKLNWSRSPREWKISP